MNQDPTQPLGGEGETCRGCRASLAADQRYCLNCGRRRGDARVDFEAELLGPPAGQAAQPAAAAAPPRPGGAWTPLSIVGSVAALGVMLLLGVLIGRDDGQPVQVAAVPAAPVAQTAATGAGAGAAATGTAAKTADKSGGGGGGGKDTGGGGGGGGGGKDDFVPADQADGATSVSDDSLDQLDQASGDDYAQQSKNLPDTIALPGEPPPTDNKEPGAGTGAQVIK